MRIEVLSATLASQIAAGEVVERPSSVVKELVENALDAGATSIAITVRGGGRDLIQVADNGSGIPADEIETAFLRHATSKLSTAADLAAIRTLGFRGEALAAIAAVSRVTVVSKTADAQAGTRLQLEAGDKTGRELVGAPLGTVIAVENLFYNTPARLKFLKSVTTERRLIDDLVTRYAMANPAVRFRLTHENRITFQTTGNGNLQEVLGEVYGVETAAELLSIKVSEAGQDRDATLVDGFVGPPAMNWANRSRIILFVNGRWIKDTTLTYAVIQAYHTLLPSGRFPMGIIFIHTPVEDVDVNVHPAKTEVRFRRANTVFSAVQRAVRETLVAGSPIPLVSGWDSGMTGMHGGWKPAGRQDLPWPRAPEQNSLPLDYPPPEADLQMPAPEHDGREAFASSGQEQRDAGARLPIMRVIGQVGQAYIITEGPDGLYLIDQHAAHERILYEKYMADWEQHTLTAQGLVAPAAVTVAPSQVGLVEENLSLLQGLGFEIEPFGPNTFQVRAVPALIARLDPAKALQAVVEDLEQGEDPLRGKREARVVLRICKSAAIKAGQTLSRPEMEALVQQLEACDSPRTCPHGRPTMIHLSAAQLAREFGRT